jgi:hypothetical protein
VASKADVICYVAVNVLDADYRQVARDIPTLRERMLELNPHLWLEDIDIYAYLYDGSVEIPVPCSVYAEKSNPSREEAIDFITDREREVAEHEAQGNLRAAKFSKVCGGGRCLFDDDLETQIADYIQTAPFQWLSNEEIVVNEEEWLKQQLLS